MDRFIFSSYYDARQHIEKYIYWYDNIRRHGALKEITPEEKWMQGWACSLARQPHAPAHQDVTRRLDLFERGSSTDQPLGTNLDKPTGPSYLNLAGEQEQDGLVANSFEKMPQLLGG